MPLKNGKLSAWLQLIRVPNLLTVPGDPLAGIFLAASSSRDVSLPTVAIAIAAGMLLYVFGLISNDLFDLKDDLKERPDRPIPSGTIKPLEAFIAAIIILVSAMGIASLNGRVSLAVAGVLALVILVYNAGIKKIGWLGPINMGLCRGLSLMLGASSAGLPALWSHGVLVAAGLLTTYITAVTVIAAKETTNIPPGSKRWGPAFSVAVFLVPLSAVNPPDPHILARMFAVCLAFASIVWSWRIGVRLSGMPAPGVVPACIGGFIQGLLFIQALLLSLCGWPAQLVAAGIILASPVFSVLARKFYSS